MRLPPVDAVNRPWARGQPHGGLQPGHGALGRSQSLEKNLGGPAWKPVRPVCLQTAKNALGTLSTGSLDDHGPPYRAHDRYLNISIGPMKVS